jgi:serine/threonine-protein kinase
VTASYEQIIGGRYALYGPIASGGMAAVHFGRLLGTGGFARTVAIKRLKGEFLDKPELITTLLDEARLASRIRHPNVVATLDMVAGEEEVFLVMEYVAGETLARLFSTLQQRGERVSPRIAAGIMTGVLYGLHAAHEATNERGEPLEIVHRDVSPQNVLVGADGLARLLDFGIAKGKGRLQTTRAGQLKGKVSYMSPEQILGEEPDRRSDVYAAAVVLWETLTGRRLFPSGETVAESYDAIPKILEADVEPPSVVAPEVPKELDGIVMRGLNRHRETRWPTARDFAVALEETVGVATPRQIGEWMQDLAARTLAEREELVRELEAQLPIGDRHSVGDIVDATVSRRRRKKLSSQLDEEEAEGAAGEPAEPDFNKTVPEKSELEEALTRAKTLHREPPTRVDRPVPTRVRGPARVRDPGERDAELARRIDARDREQARAFLEAKRLAESRAREPKDTEGVTSQIAVGESPGSDFSELDAEPADVRHLTPGRGAPAPSTPPPSFEDEVALPVQSNRALFIGAGVVALIVILAIMITSAL